MITGIRNKSKVGLIARFLIICTAVAVLAFSSLLFAYGSNNDWWLSVGAAIAGAVLLFFGIFASIGSVVEYAQDPFDSVSYEEPKLVLTTDLLAPLEQRIENEMPQPPIPSRISPPTPGTGSTPTQG